jgi:ankyrin repeat protein
MGLTALHHASRYGHKDIVRFLIAYAPNSIINMIDNDKSQTALHKAAIMKRRSICYMLVAAGSNLLIQDNEGKTPKILALDADDHELAAYLESKLLSISYLLYFILFGLPSVKSMFAKFIQIEKKFNLLLHQIYDEECKKILTI